MRSLILSAALMALALPAAAQQAVFTPDGVVDFFQQDEARRAKLGATRGLCVGTAEECDPKPRGRDMLVTFELNSADLTPEARENLAIFAEALADERLADARFVVEGHTDARGSETFNADLSEARAASVKSYLAELGVSEERLRAIGLGESAPRTADGLDPENRRVELRIDIE